VKLLLDNEADPHLKSKVSQIEEESILQTAARWNNIKIFEYLLASVKWCREEVKQVLKMAEKSSRVHMLAKKYAKTHFNCW